MLTENANLLKAANFAALKHSNQRRKDAEGTPYINHPIGVANILLFEGGISDVDVLVGALLHDTVEDTNTTFEEIEREFGHNISAGTSATLKRVTFVGVVKTLVEASTTGTITIRIS